jgi:hypothetical protein
MQCPVIGGDNYRNHIRYRKPTTGQKARHPLLRPIYYGGLPTVEYNKMLVS